MIQFNYTIPSSIQLNHHSSSYCNYILNPESSRQTFPLPQQKSSISKSSINLFTLSIIPARQIPNQHLKFLHTTIKFRVESSLTNTFPNFQIFDLRFPQKKSSTLDRSLQASLKSSSSFSSLKLSTRHD